VFLIYPSVSATVMKLFVCRKITDTSYLVVDFTIQCNAVWARYAKENALYVLLYPIGIPLALFGLLYRNRNRLLVAKTRFWLGFLYDAYELNTWWFEIVDMMYKLFMTSLLAFFPVTGQLPTAMVIAVVYLNVLLLLRPYIRKGDDRLHLLCQVELFLFVTAAYILNYERAVKFSKTTDVLLSVVLCFLTIMLLLFCLLQITGAVRKMIFARLRAQIDRDPKFALTLKTLMPTEKPQLSNGEPQDEVGDRDGGAPESAELPDLLSSLSPSLVDAS